MCCRLGLDSLLEVMQEDEDENDSDKEPNQSGSGSGAEGTAQTEPTQNENDDYDYDRKSDTAEDFSEINELAEDLQSAMLSEKVQASTGDNYDETDDLVVKNTVKDEPLSKEDETSAKQQSTTISDETKSNDNDKELMPPPSAPIKSTLR